MLQAEAIYRDYLLLSFDFKLSTYFLMLLQMNNLMGQIKLLWLWLMLLWLNCIREKKLLHMMFYKTIEYCQNCAYSNVSGNSNAILLENCTNFAVVAVSVVILALQIRCNIKCVIIYCLPQLFHIKVVARRSSSVQFST